MREWNRYRSTIPYQGTCDVHGHPSTEKTAAPGAARGRSDPSRSRILLATARRSRFGSRPATRPPGPQSAGAMAVPSIGDRRLVAGAFEPEGTLDEGRRR